MNTEEILKERGSRYGSFTGHANITQNLKDILRAGHSYSGCTHAQIEAMEMICHKLGRIVNGDPNYADSWVDIAGYATLVSDILEGKEEE